MTMFGRAAPDRQHKYWATYVLIGFAAVPYLLAWASPDIRSFLVANLALSPDSFASQPWTILTYPFASAGYGGQALFMILLCWWMYMIATSLERDLGGPWLLGVFGIATLLHGLMAVLAASLNPGATLIGVSLPESFLTILWCARNQGAVIRVFGIIPVTGKILAIVTAVVTLFGYGAGATGPETRLAPLFGLAVTTPLLLSWLYGLNKLPLRYGLLRRLPTSDKKQQKEFDKFITNVRDREKDREEKERLRKLFEDSLDDK